MGAKQAIAAMPTHAGGTNDMHNDDRLPDFAQ